MPRALIVEIFGSAKEFAGELDKAAGKTRQFGKVAGVAGLALAGTLAVGLEKSVKAAIEGQVSQQKLGAALKATHQSLTAMKGPLDDAEAASRKLGFTDDETRSALARLEIATGSTKKAVADLAVAQGLARAKGLDLATATGAMAQAMTGSQRAAKQLGIIVPPVTAAVQKLKDAGVDNSTALGRQELKMAAVTDKMATGQKVIEATAEKVRGQAQAFSDSAAGGMAQFHAQTQHLEETLGGALLPALTKVSTAFAGFADYLSKHTTLAKVLIGAIAGVAAGLLIMAAATWAVNAALLANPVVLVIAGLVALGIALVTAYQTSARFRAVVHEAFQDVKNVVAEVMPTIRSIISQVVGAVEALWREFGSTIKSVASTALHAVEQVFRDAGKVISGVVALIGDIIHGRWANIWGDLRKIVTNALDAMATLLRTEITVVGQIALALGKALIDGILHGVEGLGTRLYDSVKGKIEGAINSVKGFFHIFSPSRYTAEQLGAPLAQGIIVGFEQGMAGFPKVVSDTLDSAFVAGRKKINDWFTILLGDAKGVLQEMRAVVDSLFALNIPRTASTGGSIAGSLGKGTVDRALGDTGGPHALPGFASGGVVPGPTGQPMVAVVHGGEVVTPAGGNTGGVNVTIHVAGSVVTENQLIQAVQRGMLRYSKDNGGTLRTVLGSGL